MSATYDGLGDRVFTTSKTTAKYTEEIEGQEILEETDNTETDSTTFREKKPKNLPDAGQKSITLNTPFSGFTK